MENKNKNKNKTGKKNNSQWQIIKVNVGGQVFETTVATVSSCDNKLRHMVSGAMKRQPDEHGHVFIDRSGKHFSSVLNYLRDGTVSLPHDPCLLHELQAEAQYYLVEGLIHLCQQALDRIEQIKPTNITVPIVSSDEEINQLLVTTSKPIITLAINRHLFKCENTQVTSNFYEDIIQNIELFEKLSLKLSGLAIFVRDFRKQSEYGCIWSFYYGGRLRNVIHACDFEEPTSILFPELDINDEVMQCILNYDKCSDCEPPNQNIASVVKTEENLTPPPHLCPVNYPDLDNVVSVDAKGFMQFTSGEYKFKFICIGPRDAS